MSNLSFALASRSEPSTCYDAIDSLNGAIRSMALGIDGGDYQVVRSSLSAPDCETITRRLWSRFYSVGASRFSLQVISGRRDLHPASFLSCRTGDGLIDHVTVKDDVVVSALGNGGTLVFDHSQEYIPEVQVVQESLETQLGCPCWVQC